MHEAHNSFELIMTLFEDFSETTKLITITVRCDSGTAE